MPTLSELARRANYTASFEGISSFGSPLPGGSRDDRSSYRSTSAEGRDINVVREPNESTGAKADPVKLVTPDPNTQGGAFANLILVGWLNDAGNYVIFVQNTETKKLQKVTSEPNKDHFRIIEIRPNADPKLVEAVISKAMNDIRSVSLSDLHFRAENHLLTRLTSVGSILKVDPTTASDVMIQLADCLRLLISQNHGPQKPTLILNGDALELAFTDVNVAAMVFERFMELTMKPGDELFDKAIYYNPGNHDHHLWGKLPEK